MRIPCKYIHKLCTLGMRGPLKLARCTPAHAEPRRALTFSNSSRMGEGKWPDTQSAASRPRAIASATEVTPNRHMTESVSPYTTWGGGWGCETRRPLHPPARRSSRPSRAVGRVAPDLGIGAVATRHRILGLHQLLRLLDHLAPEASDALWGETKWVGPRGGVPCRLAVPPQPFPKVWTALSPSVPLGLRFQVCKSGY